MSNITSENYHQLLTSETGDLVYDIDEFSSPPDSPRPLTPEIERMDMDVDMDCRLDTIEQANFSGLGPGGIIAERVTNPVPMHPNPITQQTTIPDTETAVDWDSILNVPDATVPSGEMQRTQFQGLQFPLRPASRYESFPCPVQTELQEAADTPLTDPRSPTVSARSSTVSGRENGSHACAAEEDLEMEIDDDCELAAATDVLSLEPPFWNSSSDDDASDDEDDTTFANNGWADEAELQVGQDWSAKQQLLEELRCEGPEERVRDWVRRGAFSG